MVRAQYRLKDPAELRDRRFRLPGINRHRASWRQVLPRDRPPWPVTTASASGEERRMLQALPRRARRRGSPEKEATVPEEVIMRSSLRNDPNSHHASKHTMEAVRRSGDLVPL